MKLVVFFGYKGGGKTTAIEATVRAMKKAGLKVGTIKHVHEPSFSIDTPGKDTWRHAKAGASAVAVVARHEVAVIQKRDTRRLTAREVAEALGGGLDFVLVEGMHGKTGPPRGAVHGICAEDVGQAEKLLRLHPGARFVTGRVAVGKRGCSALGVPYVVLPEDGAMLLRILTKGGGRGKQYT
ncbi:MAG: molybdopterin-guanine dinucleotide biosynthesis protein B [Nitrososphaerota archaeon]|nr:molybdopterin-guanine dinucleotide biosynthesis protein B [Nitrososphaerota archaeon]